MLPAEGFDEKKSLMWAGNDYPDVFNRAVLTNAEIVKYGSMGVLAPLEDLIPTYAPNLQKLIDENPAILSRILAPDGHIYALPAIFTLNAARCEKFWINKGALDKAGLAIPTTLDELEKVLTAMQAIDLNGNGKQDEYPLGAATSDTLINRFAGSFGNQIQFFDRNINVVDGKVSSYLADDSMKAELQFLAGLYKKGLIDPDIFTQEYAKHAAKMAGHQYGLFFNQADDTFDSTNFVGIAPFKGIAATVYAEAQPVARDNGVFAIGAGCQYPEAALRFIDYFYGEEGSILMRYGVEGENMFFDDAGKPHYNEGTLDSPEGSSTVIGRYTIWPGGNAPQWVNDDNCEAISSVATRAATEALNPYFPQKIYAEPLLDTDTNTRLSILENDLKNYRKETHAKFIRGDLNFESDWDIYVETINKIGLQEWVSIFQAAYDRLA